MNKLIPILLIAIALILLFKKEPRFPCIRLTRNGVHGYFFSNDDVNTFGLLADDSVGFPRGYLLQSNNAPIEILGHGTEGHPISVDSY